VREFCRKMLTTCQRLVLTGTLGFVACGGTSVKRVSSDGDDDDGQGGTSARAGKSGSGATAARGGSRGGSGGSGGSGTVGGSGPTGGSGGTRTEGGTTSLGGTGGRSGAAGSVGCDCTVDGETIDCTSDTVRVPSLYRDPDECTLSDATIKKSVCSDGSIKYEIDEGGEYNYVLEVDAKGAPVYFYASGYASVVDACGIDSSNFFEGTLTSGKKLPPSNCEEPCSICGPAEGVVGCGACMIDAATGTAHLSLEEYCHATGCPATITEAREQRVLSCMLGHSEIASGCGIDIMQQEVGESGIAYYFDHASGKLQGIAAHDDVPFGPCGAWSYQVGTVSDGPCGSVTTCDFCAPTGEGGAGGAAGADGFSLCAP